MKILVLLPRVPYPLEKGDKLRAFYQIKELSLNNEIILCALNHDRKLDKQKAFKKLQPYCRSINFIDLPRYAVPLNIIKSFLKGFPLQVGYFYNSKANKKIKKLFDSHKPDHVFCQLVRTAEYGKNLNVSKTIDYQDVFSYGVKRRIAKSAFWLKPVLKLEYKRLVAYEDIIFENFDVKTIISVPDRELINHPEKNKIQIIPNGVDHDFFKPIERQKKYSVVFTGNMGYPPNIDAAVYLVNEIMPLVWGKIPDAKVLLAGASPDIKVKALEKKNVTVSGWIDDIRDAYASAKVFIAPMRIGTGLQNKLLEAMSMKIPSITTSLANGALNAENGKHILIGDNAGELASSIIRLLTDERLSVKIAEAGYNFVHKNYSWKESTAKLEKLMMRESDKYNKFSDGE
jgi:sugar transferase (PEP-CTERM/EpsH1 system associated)